MIVHLTTVHNRRDVRIFVKQVNVLARELPHEVALVVADGKANELSENKPAVIDLGRLQGARIGRVLYGSIRAFKFARMIKPDVVHFHDPELIPLCILLKLLRIKVVYDVHEDLPIQILSKHWIHRLIRFPIALSMAILEKVAATMFDAVIPATPKIAERFPPKKTVVVQNFPIKSELVMPTATPYAQRPHEFAYVGGISKIRGARELIMALGFLEHFPELKLNLAGSLDPESFIQELYQLPAWSSVNYLGFLSRTEIAGLLLSVRAGMVMLHPIPNYVESYPVKMFEYMAAGLPVIASDFPLWRKIIEGAGCGLLVDPMIPEKIAEAMKWILMHPDEAEAMGQRGRKAVEEIYNWDKEAIKLIDLYKKLLWL